MSYLFFFPTFSKSGKTSGYTPNITKTFTAYRAVRTRNAARLPLSKALTGRCHMAVSYMKLWKLLIDKEMKKQDLRNIRLYY